jgi:hypothetical protein
MANKPPASNPVPAKNRALPWWGALLILGIFIIFLTVGLLTHRIVNTNEPTVPVSSAKTYAGPEVEYEITGTASSVDVTLSNAQGDTEQFSNVTLSHSKVGRSKIYPYDSFPSHFLYISARNQDNTGNVTVSIYVNGNLFKTSTSEGPFAIASASGYK